MSPLFVFGVGLLKLLFSTALAVAVVFVTYRVFIKANTDFDEELEIKKGNASVGLLVAALLVASANIIHKALSPLMDVLALQVASSGAGVEGGGFSLKMAFYAAGHLVLAFVLSVAAISFSLRLFGKLTTNVQEGKELHKGNLAVGIVLSGVVFVVALYIGEGVNALAKAMLPQPSMTRMQIMR